MSLIKNDPLNKHSKSLIHQKSGNYQDSTLYSNAVVLEGHNGPVLGTKFNHNGSKIASAGIDKTIKIWDLPTNGEDKMPDYGVINGHKSAVTSIRWSLDDTMIYSSSADKTVGIWDVETGKRIRNNKFHELAVNEVDFSKDSLALSVSDDGYALIWDQREKDPVIKIKSDYPMLTGVISNNGNSFYISGIEPTIKAFDIRCNENPLWECHEQKSSITSLAINSDDSALIARSFDGLVMSLNANDYIAKGNSRINPILYEGAVSGSEYQLIRVCFNAKSISIASGSEDKTLTIWNYNSGSCLKLEGHNGTVLDVDYHPHEEIILSSSTDGNLIVREIN